MINVYLILFCMKLVRIYLKLNLSTYLYISRSKHYTFLICSVSFLNSICVLLTAIFKSQNKTIFLKLYYRFIERLVIRQHTAINSFTIHFLWSLKIKMIFTLDLCHFHFFQWYLLAGVS